MTSEVQDNKSLSALPLTNVLMLAAKHAIMLILQMQVQLLTLQIKMPYNVITDVSDVDDTTSNYTYQLMQQLLLQAFL